MPIFGSPMCSYSVPPMSRKCGPHQISLHLYFESVRVYFHKIPNESLLPLCYPNLQPQMCALCLSSPTRLCMCEGIVRNTVWLPATTKTKLVKQVLVQKGRGLFRCHDLEEWWTPVSETIPFPVQSHGSYRAREGRSFFFFYLIILPACGSTGPVRSSF